jgi:hypothetical protein
MIYPIGFKFSGNWVIDSLHCQYPDDKIKVLSSGLIAKRSEISKVLLNLRVLNVYNNLGVCVYQRIVNRDGRIISEVSI